MPQPVVVVDAFTSTPFAGNPAAVCVLPSPASDPWMRQVAREMNLAETAFLHAVEDGYALRWFTPTVEVDLCGHATLAGAHVLWSEGHLPPDRVARFHTRSGLLTAERRDGRIILDFPATPAEPVTPPAELLGGLVIDGAAWVGQSRLDYLVVLDDEAQVRGLKPDFRRLAPIPVRGVIVTSRAAPGQPYDFVSRYFAPNAGIDEDPVTGSAHCTLGPYWAGRLGRTDLTGFQASARGGTVRVRQRGDRVELGGEAVTVLRGVLL
jgi:PhzF family phenazine biosynthesis protein